MPSDLEARIITLELELRALRRRLESAESKAGRALQQVPGNGGGGDIEPDDVAIHATGVVTTEITKATSATVPGEGAFKPYTTFDATGPLLGDLVADAEAIFSIDLDYKIIVDAVVHAIRWKKAWWVIHVDSCTSLDDS